MSPKSKDRAQKNATYTHIYTDPATRDERRKRKKEEGEKKEIGGKE